MKRKIASIGIALSTVALFGCGGRSVTTAEAGGISPFVGPIIEVSDSVLSGSISPCDTLDLGRIGSGEIVEKQTKIYNHTNKPFVIIGIETSCGCVAVDYPKAPIKPNEQVVVSFTFDSNGLSGWQMKLLKLRTSIGAKPIRVYITAQVE